MVSKLGRFLKRLLISFLADYILSYKMPPETEKYALTPDEQAERHAATSSNLRAMPPPLFSRYTLPMNYK